MPDPVFALSLTDPYLHLEERDEVLRVTEEFTVKRGRRVLSAACVEGQRAKDSTTLPSKY